MIDKPKAGFQIPLVDWMLTDLKPLVDKYLTTKILDDEIFNINEVMAIKQDFYSGNHVLVNSLWFILMFQMWRERWDV
jgi:asparagine synthase (glutamine-hydrolysing)